MSPAPAMSHGAILRDSVTAVWNARRDLMDFALLPIIYALGLSLFVYFAADGPILTTDADGNPVPGDAVYFLNALIAVPTAMFIAGWTRRALYGAGGVAHLPGLGWNGTDTRVLFSMLALVFGVILVTNVIGLVAQAVLGSAAANPFVATLIVFVPGIYLFARLVLRIPAAASASGAGFINAWKLSAGNGHRIAFVLIVLGIGSLALTFFAVALVTMPLAALYGADGGIGIGGNVATSVFSLLVYFASVAVGCEALARIYRELGGPLAPPAGPATQAANDDD